MRPSLSRVTHSRWSLTLLALVLFAIIARLALPYGIHLYLNRVLARHPNYTGTVGDVGVSLYRGAYEIHDVEISKRGGRAPVPFLKTPLVDVSIEWIAIFRAQFVAEVVLDRPQLNFVAGPTEADRQTGVSGQWESLVEKLAPTKIDRFEVRDGRLHFRNFHSRPRVDVSLQHLDLVAANLAKRRVGERPGRLDARASFERAGLLLLRAAFDPHAEVPSFDADLVVKDAELPAWNDFLRAYAKLDVQQGTMSLYAELLAENGAFDGYVKPFFSDVEVLDSKEVEGQSLWSTAWEAFVDGVLEVFRNRDADDVATRIPLAGRPDDPRARFWPALGNTVYNAFIEGLAPRLEHSVGSS